MKCLIVNGSARLPGNSSAVCDYLAELLAAHEVERIDLASRRIQMC